ncbi:hypothetical protein ABZY58_29105 [Micromonospora tulbaghiae]|uniref:hypothetical protein n=1 Tax=Micromonospora tulbaghiae TaxID=479978 RepID=UPI0033AD1F66
MPDLGSALPSSAPSGSSTASSPSFGNPDPSPSTDGGIFAGLGLRFSPDTIAAAVTELFARSGTEWYGMAELILQDAFTAGDVAAAFSQTGTGELDGFLRALPHQVTHSPRRWPVDVGSGHVPVRRLDEAATRRTLADILTWLHERCYFARELDYPCVDARDDEVRDLGDVIAARLGLPEVTGVHDLIGTADVGRLADIIAVAREYIAVPPERHYHDYAGCGWHPGTGTWSAGLGRRILDDLVGCVAANSDLGALLLAGRHLGDAAAAAAPQDPLRRTSGAAYAPAEAFLPHGSILTVTRLVTRLAAGRHLDAAAAFLRAHRVHVETAGETSRPTFTLTIEIFDADRDRLRRHETLLTRTLGQLTAMPWTIRYTRPPEYRRPAVTTTLEPAAVAAVLERAGRGREADTALQATFRFRPQPGVPTGAHLVAVLDDPDSEDALLLEDAIWRHFTGLRAIRAAGGREQHLVDALRPPGLRGTPPPRPRVCVITSRGHVGSDIAPKLDGGVLDVQYRTFAANAAGAADELAAVLRALAGDPGLDGVLIARGGGDRTDLGRLVTTAVRTAVDGLRQAGKTVVLAVGHGTFAAGLPADFEAITPADAAHAIRAILVDHPAARRMAAAETQERIAVLPLDDRWPDAADRETRALRQRLTAIDLGHEAALTRMRQPPTAGR